MANIFLDIDAQEADEKRILGMKIIALRKSVETNARILRMHMDELKNILATNGVSGPTPLLNAEETATIKQVIQFLIYGGGTNIMAKVDGQPFEGMEVIVTEAKTLVV